MNQPENTNRTRMENVLLLAITIGSEDIYINRARLDKTLIHTNQASASIDIRGHSDQDFSFGERKSGYEMIIDFRRNMNNSMTMKLSRNIGSITSQITSRESGTGNGRNISVRRNSSYGTPPRNIGILGLFSIWTLDIPNRGVSWHGTPKS